MRVAVLSTIAWRTPPLHYGPWEQVASNIAEGLVGLGHDVTLFATGNSITAGKLKSVVQYGYEEDRSYNVKVYEGLHISNLMECANDFDVIHNHFDFLPLTYSKLIKTPMLTTIHGFSSPDILPVYQKYNSNTAYVSISNADREHSLNYLATVYNGLKLDDFEYVEKPKDYLLFFGRIHKDKGTAAAIEIAKKTKRQLIIAGIIQDQLYFDEEVKPHLNEQIQYIGSANSELRKGLLGNAYALLHPIFFDEPFGLSVAEAMLCGTPVIAFNRGAMPELIADAKTGFLVKNIDEAVAGVEQLVSLKRSDCYHWAKSKFAQEKMVADYVTCYQSIIK